MGTGLITVGVGVLVGALVLFEELVVLVVEDVLLVEVDECDVVVGVVDVEYFEVDDEDRVVVAGDGDVPKFHVP